MAGRVDEGEGAHDTSSGGDNLATGKQGQYGGVWASGNTFKLLDLPLLVVFVGVATALIVIFICFIYVTILRKCQNRSSDKSHDVTGHDVTHGDEESSDKIVRLLPSYSSMKNRPTLDESAETNLASVGTDTSQAGAIELKKGGGLVELASQEPSVMGSPDPDDIDTSEIPICQYGRLWFSVVYDEVAEKLFIRVIKAKYLKPRDKSNTLRDPFVKVYLLPEENNCQESRIVTVEDALPPRDHFDKTFAFPNERRDLIKYKTVRLSVYDIDIRRVRHTLGHVIFPLATYDVASGVVMWRDLELLDDCFTSSNWNSVGEMSVSLVHDPQSETLTVSVNETRNLHHLEFMTKYHTVQLQLKLGERVLQVMRTSPRPFMDRTQYDKDVFVFSLPFDQLNACSLTAALILEPGPADQSASSDESSEQKSQPNGVAQGDEYEYGFIVLGSEVMSNPDEVFHWQTIRSRPCESITRWHSLRSAGVNNHP